MGHDAQAVCHSVDSSVFALILNGAKENLDVCYILSITLKSGFHSWIAAKGLQFTDGIFLLKKSQELRKC